MSRLDERRREFNVNVWDHAVDEFQIKFDDCPALTPNELKQVKSVVRALADGNSDERVIAILAAAIKSLPIGMDLFLRLVGLTRNKILQDLKPARAGGADLRLSSSRAVVSHPPTWAIAGPYLLRRLKAVFGPVSSSTDLDRVVESLSQATWPGFIRQERAKRSGHEAEFRNATLLTLCNIPFEPEEKAVNPLCRDVQIHGVSFDIVIPNVAAPLVVVKATVHTANIGQYGESKDALEVREARAMLDSKFSSARRPLLLGFIDGVGFESNRAGLDSVLANVDEFCQYKTIWKVVAIASLALTLKGIKLALTETAIAEHKGFLTRWPGVLITKQRSASALSDRGLEADEIRAGQGRISLF